jgi:hypothetical protein
MLREIKLYGALTVEALECCHFLAIDGQSLVNFMPDAPPIAIAIVVDVRIKKGDKYVRTRGFWDVGDEIDIDTLQAANLAHKEAPEKEPLYLARIIAREWGNATITIHFGDDP